MGIFKRMKTIAKADVNGWLDRLEDPVAMLNEYSREMEQEMGKAQRALARQIYAENKQTALILDTKAMVEKRTRQAKLAIGQGEETITKLAVQEKLAHEQQLALYEQQLQVIQGQTAALREKVTELQQIYNELQHKKILLASRANVAQSVKQIQKVAGGFQTDNILRGVTRAENRIMMMEAEMQAGNQFTYPLPRLHPSYADEETVNQEIEKLRQEVNN